MRLLKLKSNNIFPLSCGCNFYIEEEPISLEINISNLNNKLEWIFIFNNHLNAWY